MAKKKPVPLKNEKILSIDDLYARLQTIEDAVKDMNRMSDESLGNNLDHGNQGCAVDAEQFAMQVATAMDNYLKAHQEKIVVEGGSQRPSRSRKFWKNIRRPYCSYKRNVRPRKETSQKLNHHPYMKGLFSLLVSPSQRDRQDGKTCSVIGSIVFPGTKYGRYLHPVISGGGYAPSFFASGSPLSSSRSLLDMTMPNCALFRRSMCCYANMPGPINNGLRRQITSSIFTPTRTDTERR